MCPRHTPNRNPKHPSEWNIIWVSSLFFLYCSGCFIVCAIQCSTGPPWIENLYWGICTHNIFMVSLMEQSCILNHNNAGDIFRCLWIRPFMEWLSNSNSHKTTVDIQGNTHYLKILCLMFFHVDPGTNQLNILRRMMTANLVIPSSYEILMSLCLPEQSISV